MTEDVICVTVLIVTIILIIWTLIPEYDKCYLMMEQAGYTTTNRCRGLVGGDRNTNYLQEQCINCPYFVSVGDNEDENNI